MTNRTRSKAKRAQPQGRRAPTRKPASRGAKRGALPRWTPWAGAAAVIALIGVAVLLRSTGSAEVTTSAGSTVVQDVTNVPASTLNAVGAPGGLSVPGALPSGTAAIEQDGKPLVLYVGAEYCPFCAAERWPMVVALSRFGTFSNLGQTESAGAPEVYPHTATLSFHGSSYTSPSLAFQGVETESNQRSGVGYAPLDTLTPEQERLLQTYDTQPYVSTAGAIPFVLIGNRYVFNGAQFLPDSLRGMTAEQVAASLADPTTQQAKDIDGSANILTAAICTLTDQQPSDVCSSPGVAAAASKLPG